MMTILRKRLDFMNVNLCVLTLRQLLAMFFMRMVFSYSSLYVLEIGGGDAEIGLINSLGPLAGLLMFPIAGYLTDRTGRVRLIALAGYLSALTLSLNIFAPSWEWIALGALLQGFMVFQFPPLSAIIVDSIHPEKRGVGIATMQTLANTVAIFSPYLAGFILELYGIKVGMRLLYALLASSHVINATIVLKYLKETAILENGKTTQNILTILNDAYSGIPRLIRSIPRSIKALGVLVGMGFIANGIASPFWVVYVTDIIGLSSIDWGLILLFESIFRTILTLPCGVIADRYGRTKTLFAAIVLSLVSMPSLILADTFLHVLLIRLIVGLAGALFLPASTALMADYIPQQVRGRVMAAIGRGGFFLGAAGGGTGGPGMGYIFTIPVMVASVIGGLLYSQNPTYPWICVLGTTIIQLLSIMFFIRDPEKAEH